MKHLPAVLIGLVVGACGATGLHAILFSPRPLAGQKLALVKDQFTLSVGCDPHMSDLYGRAVNRPGSNLEEQVVIFRDHADYDEFRSRLNALVAECRSGCAENKSAVNSETRRAQ